MSVKKYTAEELIETVRNDGMIPDVGATGSQDVDILAHLNKAMLNEMIPDLMKTREEYFVVSRRQAITTPRCRIPARAIGQKLRDVVWFNNTERTKLFRLAREDLIEHSTIGTTAPYAFYIEGNHIVFVPDAGSFAGSVELSFFFRPGQLVLSTETRTVSAVDTTLKTITLSSAPPSSWDASMLYDVHSPNSGAEIKLFDLAIGDLTGNIITAIPAIDGSDYGTYTPAAGDYVCLAGEAALPALPIELHPILAQAGLVRYLLSQGDIEHLKANEGQLNRMLVNAGIMCEDRVSGRPQKLVRRSPFF